ncbi:MAG: hypothetical protein RR368_05815, partial [Oscillospiraceae bacterium]
MVFSKWQKTNQTAKALNHRDPKTKTRHQAKTQQRTPATAQKAATPQTAARPTQPTRPIQTILQIAIQTTRQTAIQTTRRTTAKTRNSKAKAERLNFLFGRSGLFLIFAYFAEQFPQTGLLPGKIKVTK